MRCQICDQCSGEEAGWFICETCMTKQPKLAESILRGKVIWDGKKWKEKNGGVRDG